MAYEAQNKKIEIQKNQCSMIGFFCCAVLILTAFGAGEAQTKRRVFKDEKPFSVPCAKALRIGVSAVEKLYVKDMDRRTGGKTDSDTEGEAMENALKKYVGCRRADNAAKLKTFTAADTKAEVKRQEIAARRLAEARFDRLIPYIVWDENGDDLFAYRLTMRAVAFVEDYKGALVESYSSDVEPDTDAAQSQAARDEKTIRALLIKMETREFYDNANACEYKIKFPSFKKSVETFLRENSDRIDKEKAAAANFVVRLLKLGSSD